MTGSPGKVFVVTVNLMGIFRPSWLYLRQQNDYVESKAFYSGISVLPDPMEQTYDGERLKSYSVHSYNFVGFAREWLSIELWPEMFLRLGLEYTFG